MTIGQSGDAPGTVVIGDPIDDASTATRGTDRVGGFGAAPGIAFIAVADTSVLARVYADKRGARATPTRNSSRLAWSTSQPACSRECR